MHTEDSDSLVIPKEDRQDLLGHKSTRMTTHYSSAELLNLWQAANTVCARQSHAALTVLRVVNTWSHEKVTNAVFSAAVNVM